MGRLSKQAQDEKILKENPDASPQELLAAGLSQEAYETYMDSQKPQRVEPKQEAAPAKSAPIEPTVTKAAPAVPKLQAAPPSAHYSGDVVTVISPEGTRTQMTRVAAERFKRGGRNANYQIEG